MIDTLEAEGFGPLGTAPLQVLDLADADSLARAADLAGSTQAIVIGVDHAGTLPRVDPAPFDALFTAAPRPPRPWVGVSAARLPARLAGVGAIVGQAPVAATTALQVLRIGEHLPFDEALTLESLAYSALLGGGAFARWRAATPQQPGAVPAGPFVTVDRADCLVTITLAQPARRNALCAGMRDALFEALAATLDDPTAPAVRLVGAGACFSTGGDLAEFGTARDLAQAHAVRRARSAAALVYRLRNRVETVLHGACIGSGIEVPAAAARRIGRRGFFAQLPELTMGLMPGAGGTVTLPRAIGRHRTAAMLLTARRIDASTALDWGLLTALEPES